jgi:hypothetical protein
MALSDPAYLNLTYNRSFYIDSYNSEVATKSTYPVSLIISKSSWEEEI